MSGYLIVGIMHVYKLVLSLVAEGIYHISNLVESYFLLPDILRVLPFAILEIVLPHAACDLRQSAGSLQCRASFHINIISILSLTRCIYYLIMASSHFVAFHDDAVINLHHVT